MTRCSWVRFSGAKRGSASSRSSNVLKRFLSSGIRQEFRQGVDGLFRLIPADDFLSTADALPLIRFESGKQILELFHELMLDLQRLKGMEIPLRSSK